METPAVQEEPCTSSQPPKCFVIIHSVSKRHNIGTLLRSCTAFGVTAAVLVGSRNFNAFGSQGADAYVACLHFPTLEACCQHLKEVEGCRVLGVEIADGAAPVQHHPFCGNTAFMLGNEGHGLTERQVGLCDGLIYIPQHGPGTASLNVTVAASIILHHFALWAHLPERERTGGKFLVAERPQRITARGVVPLTGQEKAERSAARAAQQQQGEDADNGLVALFE